MPRISHAMYSTVFGVAYLGLVLNLLLAIACVPIIVLLFITDPMYSWPLIALAAPLCAPALTAAFTAFRAHHEKGDGPAEAFLVGWRATWRRALGLGAVITAAVVVMLVDVRFFSDSAFAVVTVPLLAVLCVIVAAMGIVALVALSEAPKARLRDILQASIYLSLRRWYLSLVTLAALATQVMLFTSLPAVALGLTAAPALYLAWANARYTLRPVLETTEVAAA
tara:strand:- start:17154 stop:17825 length:672 start_codon:yes stop_codon:yes gene_type:complete